MADTMPDYLDRILECSICLERFATPKMLKCQHTFCQECLRGLDRRYNCFRCPLCNTRTRIPKGGVEKLPNSLVVGELLHHVDATSGLAACEDCGTPVRPAAECRQCSMWLCAVCTASHGKVAATAPQDNGPPPPTPTPRRSVSRRRYSPYKNKAVSDSGKEVSVGLFDYYKNAIFRFCETILEVGVKKE